MTTSVVRARLAATVSLVALSLATPTLAQSAQEQAATVDDIIVTAQKREESIMSVPIAVSAFSAEMLDAMKIEGGSELLRAIPNVSFSKNNFSMFNFSIRGIGTKAISASSDPAVAISFNNAPMMRNRLFESEYLDVSRVEVLRGPQGTLYGRNATAGVVNMIPNLPRPDFDAMVKGEVGNFGSIRGQMMLNVPISDSLSIRGAASITKRDGFDYNTYNETRVNGRDLHSIRLSAAWEPTDRFSANLIWERFGEDDNRSRTGKQLCTRDPGPDMVGSAPVPNSYVAARLGQGCLAASLFTDEAYGLPNGAGMSQIMVASGIGYGYRGAAEPYTAVTAMPVGVDPFSGRTQSKNLREISTSYDPVFRAENDIIQLNLKWSLGDKLDIFSQTLYTKDSYYSSQDYMRYISNDLFDDSTNLWTSRIFAQRLPDSLATPGGVYTDPQLGASKRMESVDLSQSENDQFYQELRAQSNFDGRFNFAIGANYTKFETEDNYYVFNNTFTFLAEYFYNRVLGNNLPLSTDRCTVGVTKDCVYVDYSSISELAGDGHNYFRSRNVSSTESWAVFGEAYVDISDKLRMTLGARYTEDEKIFTPYPSQLLLGAIDAFAIGPSTGGYVSRGYPALPDIEQEWSAWTGRGVLDWKPNDNTLIYVSISRGYKGGGANPPRADINPQVVQYQPLAETFEPEYVNAFEVGVKTRILDDRLDLKLTAFHYDYTDYQVSQIVDRISLNENFDTTSSGIELEAAFRPTPNWRIDANIGYLKTRIGDGEGSIDVMNRTQGNADWTVVRPWVQVPSNCIAPTAHVETILNSAMFASQGINALAMLCGGSQRIGSFDPNFPGSLRFWQFFGFEYNPLRDAPNGGRGFEADLSGNELPNAPNFTLNVGTQYTWNLGNYDLTMRGDYYRQSESYFRVYNTEYDRLKAWGSLNLQFTVESLDGTVVLQTYVKNVLDDAPIVDAFTNSDDSMLTTNVFTLDPRVWGVSLTKRF